MPNTPPALLNYPAPLFIVDKVRINRRQLLDQFREALAAFQGEVDNLTAAAGQDIWVELVSHGCGRYLAGVARHYASASAFALR